MQCREDGRRGPEGDEDGLHEKKHQEEERTSDELASRQPSDQRKDRQEQGKVAEKVAEVAMRLKPGTRFEHAKTGQEELDDYTDDEEPRHQQVGHSRTTFHRRTLIANTRSDDRD